MELVRKQTRIAVPRKRRAIRHHHPEGNGLISHGLGAKQPTAPGRRALAVFLGEAQSHFDNAPLPQAASTHPILFV